MGPDAKLEKADWRASLPLLDLSHHTGQHFAGPCFKTPTPFNLRAALSCNRLGSRLEASATLSIELAARFSFRGHFRIHLIALCVKNRSWASTATTLWSAEESFGQLIRSTKPRQAIRDRSFMTVSRRQTRYLFADGSDQGPFLTCSLVKPA